MKKLSVTMHQREIKFGLIYLLVQLFILPEILSLLNLLIGNPLNSAGINFVFFCINLVATVIIFRDFLIASAKQAKPLIGKCLCTAGIGYLYYRLLSLLVVQLILAIYPQYYNLNDASISTMASSNLVLISIGTILIAPIYEELLFRGLIFQGLYGRNRFLAYALSTAAFAGIHVLGYLSLMTPLHLALAFLQYVPAGLILCWVYAKADSIFAPIILHVGVNLIGNYFLR